MSHGANRSQATSAPPSAGPDGRPGRRALPGRGRGPGVLVLGAGSEHDVCLGEACARLARHGFVAWAPAAPPHALEPRSEPDREWAAAGIEALFCEPATDGARVGVLAFGRAGLVAVDAAAGGGRIALVVGFGCPWQDLGDVSPALLEAPLLAVLGEKDPAAPHAESLAARLGAEGVACELRVLPGAGTDFYDPGQPDLYDAVAARSGWDAALARLRAELG